MSRTKRAFVVTLPILAGVFLFEAAGCSSSNEPSTTAAGGSGGATTGNTGGTGGATTSTGTGGAGGTSGGSGGGSGTGGSTGGSGGGGNFSPLCSAVPITMAGEAPTKGGVCTATDTQLCYKTCGPLSVGFKSETCTSGLYVEQSGCSFPDQDYACYKIPTPVSATCPTTVPQASQACTVAECTPCNVGGMYLDSGGASKEGFCVCPAAGSSGSRKWSCASLTAWPCPMGKGC
jgi:hypothetical protein